MGVLVVTPQDVQAFAPGTPPVTDKLIGEALDWVQEQFDLVALPLPDSTSEDPVVKRQVRALVRAVASRALSLLPGGTVLTNALDGERVQKLKDGSTEITFAQNSSTDAVSAQQHWEARVWEHLYSAGLPVTFTGAYAGAAL
ncbi:hypothetical protein [Deinococcus ruber]|uniref:Uncharacterized protein n=1 Tax=Deinococcus ruber TaxID=1848197 RepID=A0A918CAA3_9DEIO|nr:hypothetical protein [Deinococcus ruber]GGR11415.1 hypothetical protein GCM10008957_25240 [Deinococcus ruber]